LCETGILLLSLSRYIGDPDIIDHCGLVRGELHPEASQNRRAEIVIIPLDLAQLFCPGFTLPAGPPSGFTTDIVCFWGGGALWRACNLTAFRHSSSGPPICFPVNEGLGFNPQGGYVCVRNKLFLCTLTKTFLFYIDLEGFCKLLVLA
jgi:hypothetical protein